ncbi:MAG TPA: TonB-dependent receptor [Chitinophagaceae bacterium]|nr:TonB-dependent receptor [Chitinophagaceae bacterium]
MHRISIIAFLILISLSSFAAKKSSIEISGTIKDDKNSPIQFATILLLNSQDSSLVKGDLTDIKGEFNFDQVQEGSYLLSATNVGYEKYYSAVFSVNQTNNQVSRNIILKQNDKGIKEIKVLGKKPMIEVKADRTVFNVEQSINAAGNNALDLLRKSPGVRVDKDDNIELRGKSKVVIYIDGKPSYLGNDDLAALLKNMQSTDIEAIELITNPSAKYDAEGNAGIINIKLKKNKKMGTNGTINFGAAQGIYFKQNESINLNYRNKKVNLFGSYSFNSGKNLNNQNLDRIQNGVRYDFKADNIHKDRTHAGKVGLDYFVNSKNVIGVMVNMMGTQGDFSSSSKTLIGPENANADKVLIATNAIPGSRFNANYNVNYKFEDTMGHTFNIDLDYGNFNSKGKSYQPNTYWNLDETAILSQSIFRNNTPTTISIYSIKSDYEQNFLKGKLGFGIKSAYVKTDNDFKFYDVVNNVDTLNLSRTNHFLYTENVNAAYINYSKTFNTKLSAQIGLRAEHTNSTGQLSSAYSQDDDTVKRNYINLFPSAGVSYNLNKDNSLGLTFSRRIDRPNYQDLNPFENKLDELTYEKGNAFLRPQYTNAFDLTHTFKQYITTALSYSRTKDMYMQTTDTTEGTRTYVTQKNFASQDMMGINISFPIPLKKWWMIFANINANYVMLNADFEGRKLENNYFTYSLYAENTITLPKEISLSISGWYAGPSYWGGTFLTKPMGSMDLGLQRLFLKKRLTAKLSLSDVLLTQRWYATSNFSGLYIRGNGNNESRQIRLNLSYRFGSSQIAENRDRKSGSSNERNRIK